MLIRIALIELKKNLKSPAFYIFSLVLFIGALIFTFTQDPNTIFLGISHGKEFFNSPILIAQLATRLSVMGVLFTMILIGRSVAKDFEAGIHEIMFSFPVSKFSFLGGRFLGGLIANIMVFIGLVLGFEIGFWGLNIIAPGLCGPFRVDSYLLPMLVTVIPNILFTGSIFFGLATLSRKMVSTYIAGIAFLAIYGIFAVGIRFIDSETIKILIDPFGISGLNILTKSWTTADLNQNSMPINLMFILNRLLWIGVSILVLARTYSKFSFTSSLQGKEEKTAIRKTDEDKVEETNLPDYKIVFNFWFNLKQSLILSITEFKRILIHPAFIILTLLAMSQIVTNFVGNLGMTSDFPGATIYPFTSWYLKQTVNIWMYMLPMVILFGGMLVWKEKDNKSDEIYNVMPLPNWFSYCTKLLTLVNIQVFYLLLAIATGVITQTVFLNFYDIELGLYFKQLFGIDLINYIHIAIVVLFIQTLSPNKYMGFFLSAAYFVADLVIFGSLGVDNFLLRYGNVPHFIYSNLNGFGHYSTSIIWYTVYWALLGSTIVIITIQLWRRNVDISLKYRFKIAAGNFTRLKGIAILSLLLLFTLTGSYIAYNKYILNNHISDNEHKQMQADYELKYQQFDKIIQPTITHIDLNVDIFPKDRKVKVLGSYNLRNSSDSTIKFICINLNDWNLREINSLAFSKESEQIIYGKEFGFRVYRLNEGLLPGETVTLNFEYLIHAKGFTDSPQLNQIAENGTYLVLSGSSSAYFPLIGYNRNAELNIDKDRKDFGLQPKPDLPQLSNADRTKGFINLSRPTYSAIISTSSNQVAISNGTLDRKWEENGRNYFLYKSDVRMMDEFAIISGIYQVKSANYNGVNIEVYFHKKHHYNIDRIIAGLKDSYDYCSENFSVYPFNDLRVVEVPDYMKAGGARHFPTLFIWRESAGFTANYESNQKLDIVYGIAAHENAHHWWAGIVTPAFAEGGYMLTESLCQYVWVMTSEKRFGKKQTREYLKNEMELYQRRRKKDLEGEKPLAHSSFQQSYIGYQKSSVVMYALQEYIGEDSVGRALERIVNRFGSRLDTFALASDLVNEYYKVTPDSLKYLVNDLFYRITLYENEVTSATCKALPSGKYEVELSLKSAKFYADSIGNQTEAPLRDYIYVGLMDDNGDEIYYKKHLFDTNNKTIRLIADRKPATAGLDPFFVLIDRNIKNNTTQVEIVK